MVKLTPAVLLVLGCSCLAGCMGTIGSRASPSGPKKKVFLMIGSSNMAGFAANLADVPADDFVRWAGTTLPPALPTLPSQRPYHVTVPGVRMLTPRRPYSTNTARFMLSGAVAPTYNHDGATTGLRRDQWVYIGNQAPADQTGGAPPELASGAQGQLGRLDADAAAGAFTLTSPFPVAPLPGDTFVFLQDSRTISAVSDVMLNGVMRTVLTKTAAGVADFTASDVGRFVVFPSSLVAGNNFNYSSKIIAQTATTITLERYYGDPATAVTGIAANDIMIVCSGANACSSIATLTAANSVLQDLTFYLDENGPVFLTGTDYDNFDAGTTWQAPKTYSGPSNQPTINCVPELTWRLRQRFSDGIVGLQLGVSASMISPYFIASNIIAPLPSSAGYGAFSWFHDLIGLDFAPGGSGNNLFTVLVTKINACKALLLAEGNEADFDTCFINLADNEYFSNQRPPLIGRNMILLRDALRSVTGNPRMKWVMSGPAHYGGFQQGLIYDQLFEVERDDAWSKVVDTRAYTGFAADDLHFSALGQIQLGKDYFTAYDAVTKKANDAARASAAETSGRQGVP